MARPRKIFSREISTSVLSNDRMNFVDKELAKETKSRVYTTEIINKLVEDYNMGKEGVDMTPFFHG